MSANDYILRTESPIGLLELTGDGEHVTSLSIARAGHVPLEHKPERPDAILEEAARQLAEYFTGERHSFELPIALHGTEFQLSVWQRLGTIGWGEFLSYGELGVEVGKPGSARAIGGAVGANPIPLIVPCHRVLAGDKRITGYSGGDGIPTKVWLLDHEGIEHKTNRVPAPPPAPHTQLELDYAL
ncbi:methylated-DNA--[protein]-cysteine S-methyltransferase [Microterricola pindariensis]|uniref:Methylated-DNA--protein-cysteine methyltransferase n=1 Tax=Microterricola pindariensis TaxID=478010 RepID=A0ABX5AY81_9MICO|nr:methylated-DNA--[protein]-cysteine S-methyltransferase [Microterricola pindariensis]PPL19359.1 cysteine methyltransferase [Microterricola pindariensis]